jgi:hypothetical protein
MLAGSRLPSKRVAVITALIVLGLVVTLGVTVGPQVVAILGTRQEKAHGAQPHHEVALTPAQCITSSSALVKLSSLPDFRPYLDDRMTASPVRTNPLAPVSAEPKSVSDFALGRLVGYISNRAWRQPYLGQSQAYQKRMGYAVTNSPAVPLQGQIVADTPGFLEVYQLNTIYTTQAGAASFQKTQTTGYFDQTDHQISLGPQLADAMAYWITPAGPGEEYRYQVDLVVGIVQMDFQFRGGQSMSRADIASLVVALKTFVLTTCLGTSGVVALDD